MVKCKFCGEEVSEQARITEDGKCSICGEKVEST